MGIRTKTCTICTAEIYTSLQPSICRFMTLHTKPYIYETLDHSHSGIVTAPEKGDYSLPNKYVKIINQFLIGPIKYSS